MFLVAPHIAAALMFGATAIVSAQVTAVAAVAAVAAGAEVHHQETIASLGFPDGLAMLNPTQARDIYYHGTDGVDARNGRLHLDVAASVHDFTYAFIQVLVNDIPRWSHALGAQDTALPVDLPLSPGELAQRFVKVTLRFGGRLADDRCYDWRRNGSYLTIGPASGVRYSFSPERVNTIDGAWSVLPRRVTVALPPSPLTPSLYRVAWETASALERAGHVVSFAPAGNPTDTTGLVIVATRDDAARVQTTSGGRNDNVLLTRVGGRAVILVADTPAAQLLGDEWRHMAQGDRMHVVVSRPALQPRSGTAVTFRQLGLGSVRQEFGERAEWSFPFSVRDVPGGSIPTRVDLDVMAGLSPSRRPTVAQVFLNDVLVRSSQIDESGSPQRILVDLPRRLIGVDNTLRLVLQRQEANSLSAASGECRALPAPTPAEVLATSVIETERVDDLDDFLTLPALFGAGFDVYFPRAFLADPAGTLPFLSRLGADLLPMGNVGDVVFFDSSTPPRPRRHFLMVGTVDGLAVDAPAKVEHERLVVDDRYGVPMLDATSNTQSTVIEIARVAGQSGLLILPLHGGALPSATSIALSRGDLAFVSATGVDLSIDTRDASQGFSQLGEWFGRYRYWAYSIIALIIAVALVYNIRHLRAQRGWFSAASE